MRGFATGVESESHDDFKPKLKARVDDAEELRKQIDGVRRGDDERHLLCVRMDTDGTPVPAAAHADYQGSQGCALHEGHAVKADVRIQCAGREDLAPAQ
jgi:hypothetical protein